MKTNPIVYVCSPLRGAIEANIKRAINYCRFVFHQGGIPLAPHTIFTQFLDDQKPQERVAGMEMGLELLRVCDELWAFGDAVSEGMAKEMAVAKELGLKMKRFDSECNPFDEQDAIFKKLEQLRKTRWHYQNIPQIARQVGVTPSQYCDYRACRRKASHLDILRAKRTAAILRDFISSYKGQGGSED